jgi:hypothetical protein
MNGDMAMEFRLNILKKADERIPPTNADFDMQRQQMNGALSRFGISYDRPPQMRPAGHLIFGLDLTQSREASLKQTRIGTAAMFSAVASIGNVKVKLIWYPGTPECNASQWYDDPAILSRSMRKLSCVVGRTRIEKILQAALSERENLSGVVFIGDHCQESPDDLLKLAKTLGTNTIPLFIFHECAERDKAALKAKPIFEKMAKLSGGAYMEFKPDSGTVLREALTSLAAFSAAGPEGVRQIPTPKTPEALQLHGRLLG